VKDHFSRGIVGREVSEAFCGLEVNLEFFIDDLLNTSTFLLLDLKSPVHSIDMSDAVLGVELSADTF
jgi:hypothetical protein